MRTSTLAFGLAATLTAGTALAGPARGKPQANHSQPNPQAFENGSSGFSETSPTRTVPSALDLRPLTGVELRARFDRNSDGSLDRTERTLAETFLDQRRREFEAQLIRRFDSNRDGSLSTGEQSSAARTLRNEQIRSHNALVTAFDSNNDGILNAAEQANAKANDPERFFDVRFYSGAPQIFASISRDGFGPAHAGVYTD